jgi:hypothetical protein
MSMIRDGKGEVIDELNPLRVKATTDDIIPVDIQAHLASTIQTHNAVSVGAGLWSHSTWIDCDGFDKLAFNLLNDASTSCIGYVKWSTDGVNEHGFDEILPSVALDKRSAEIGVKLRYAKLSIKNGDTISHIMSGYAYLKA